MKHLLIVALLATFSIQASGQEHSPHMLKFARAIGIHQQIEAQRTALAEQSRDLGQQYVDQILAAAPETPPQLATDINGAYQAMLARSTDLIDTDEVVGTYLTLIGQEMSDKEIKKVTKFYESKLGKKFTEANTRVMGEWATAFGQQMNEKASANIQAYVDDLKEIVGRYQRPAGE